MAKREPAPEWDKLNNPEGIGLRYCRECGKTGALREFKRDKTNSILGRQNLCRVCERRRRRATLKARKLVTDRALGESFSSKARRAPAVVDIEPPSAGARSVVIADLFSDLRRGSLDASRLNSHAAHNPLEAMQERVQGRIASSRPWSRADIFKGFARLGFVPGGLFLPTDTDRALAVSHKMRELGTIVDELDRDVEYREYQRETETWAAEGVEGTWTWQQALARSEARFRLARYGRRGGKSTYAAAEAAALAIVRQKATIWSAAKTDDAVSRTFSLIADMLEQRGYRKTARLWRNAPDTRYIELENGSVIHGISLGGELSAAGTGVDFLVLDEAEYATELDWTKKCLPTLADKLGKALIISSAQTGDESWFNSRVEEAIADNDPNWATFDAPSWVNFYRFPQGRESQAIRDAEREHAKDPSAFLAIYGGKPNGERDKIFYSYKPKVHLYSGLEFNPWQPIICVADPSGGVNQYAVIVAQDYGADRLDIIDEFYRAGVTAEEVAAELDQRVWRNWVNIIYLDQGSNPIEIHRWAQCDWPAAPIVSENRRGEIVPGKPDLDSSVPIVNNTFRNPLRWKQYERSIMDRVLRDAGYDSLEEVPENKRPSLALELEERLTDNSLIGDDLEALRDCSGIRISKENCPNLAHELATYRKRKFRDPTVVDSSLRARKTADHLVDCLRYLCWITRRHLWQAGLASSYLETDLAGDGGYQGTNWLEAVRLQLLPRRQTEGQTYLELA